MRGIVLNNNSTKRHRRRKRENRKKSRKKKDDDTKNKNIKKRDAMSAGMKSKIERKLFFSTLSLSLSVFLCG